MRPLETSYKLMAPHDKKRCLGLARNHGMETVARLEFPTVVAKRKGRILGFLSTRPTKDAIVAGPLVVGPEVKGPIAMRLVEAYENVLRMGGAQFYLFYVDDPHWKRQVERAFEIEPYHVQGDRAWYKREIDGRQRRTPSPTGAIGI
jgi:hypothetical protein